MLSQLTNTVLSLFHVLGLCAMLIGVLYLIAAMLGGRGVEGFIKGAVFIFIGSWIGRLGS